MNTIEMLDQLAEYQSEVDALALQKRALLNDALPAEVKQRMDEIEAEFSGKSSAAQENIAKLEAEIKDVVKNGGQSVKGTLLHAVFAKGRVTWDTKALDGYVAGHPEIAPFRKEGEPSVSIRKAA